MKASQITNPVAVGDRVRYEWADGERTAVITEILPRENYVIRRSTNLSRQAHVIAANVDMAYLVVSLYFPEVKLPFLDRILVTCGVYGIPATVVLSKTDLYRTIAQEQIDAFHDIYESAGYRVILPGEDQPLLRGIRGRKVLPHQGAGPLARPQDRADIDGPPPGKAHHVAVRDVPPGIRRLCD